MRPPLHCIPLLVSGSTVFYELVAEQLCHIKMILYCTPHTASYTTIARYTSSILYIDLTLLVSILLVLIPCPYGY